MASPRIAILASGSGTTAESFIESVASGKVSGEVVLLICNNKDAAVFDKVRKLNQKYGLNIKLVHIGKTSHPPQEDEQTEYGRQTKSEEQAILGQLTEQKCDLVLLLGYMKLIGPSIVKEYGWQEGYNSIYQGRMINTHPGLLPDTKGFYGIHVQEKVISDNHPKAGNSLFIVNDSYDDGPVVAEHLVEILDDDTPESLFERVKTSEKDHLAEDINNFILEQKKYLAVE